MRNTAILAFLVSALALSACQSPSGVRQTELQMPDQLTLNRVDLREDFILQNPPASIIGQFKVQNGHTVVDGPRESPNGSIDFSDLLTNAEVHRAFMSVAFGGGELSGDVFGIATEPKSSYIGDSLVKLPRTIEVMSLGFSRPVPPHVRRLLAEAQTEITKHTGLKFRKVNRRTPGRFAIVNFFPENQAHAKQIALEFHDTANNAPEDSKTGWRNLARIMERYAEDDINCTAFPAFDDNKRPKSVLIVIKTGDEADIGCIFEELVQSMGLFRDDNSLVSTLFTDNFKYYHRPTRLDYLMLKVLYDPRLRNGMTRQQASPIVKKILAELLPYAEAPGASS